jgi:hypothetical protein
MIAWLPKQAAGAFQSLVDDLKIKSETEQTASSGNPIGFA